MHGAQYYAQLALIFNIVAFVVGMIGVNYFVIWIVAIIAEDIGRPGHYRYYYVLLLLQFHLLLFCFLCLLFLFFTTISTTFIIQPLIQIINVLKNLELPLWETLILSILSSLSFLVNYVAYRMLNHYKK